MNDRQVIAALVAEASAVLSENFYPDCCVAATRHGQEVLRYFGIASTPVKVQTVASNAIWFRWVESLAARGLGLNDEPVPEGGWSVAIDLSTDETRRYPGHLVLETSDSLVDLSVGQFSRPQYDMTLPWAAAFDLAGHESWDGRGDAGWIAEEIEGQPVALIYKRLPEKDWQSTPDWRRKPPYAGEMIRRVRDRLATVVA